MKGKELRRLRQGLGWTQQQLADEIGVAQNSVARWERDELGMKLPVEKLIRMLVAQHQTGKRKG